METCCRTILDFNDHVLRAYVALTLGCDTFIKGISGLGPAKVTNSLRAVCQRCEKENKSNEEKRQMYIEFVCKKYKEMKVEAFKAMAQAIIYEPVVEQDADKDEIYHYVFDSPDN